MKTRVDRVQAALRRDIFAGREQPGGKLPLADLARRHGAGMSVVREALIKLVAEGLVVSEPQVGFRVVPISSTDLRHLVEARCLIECEAFQTSIRQGDLVWESRVLAAHHRLVGTMRMDPEDPAQLREEWVAAHTEFHMVLMSGCENTRLLSVAMSLRDAAELYRRWSVTSMDHEGLDRDREHLALRDAALARNAEEGGRLLKEHIEHTARILGVSVPAT